MIIFGTRMYGKKNPVKGYGVCDNCGKYGKHTSYNGRKFGHIYFIPLIPNGPRMRVLKECKKCSLGSHIPETEIPTIINNLRQSCDKALAALFAGEKNFDNKGTSTPCVECLAGAVETLYCLGAADYVNLMLKALETKQETYAHRIISGESHEFLGNIDKATEAYMGAKASQPENIYPWVALGAMQLNSNNHSEALPFYEKALDLSEERFHILQVLVTIYDKLKEHAKLASTYEECFVSVPELLQDKKTVKAYKKACKKVGRQPTAAVK
jgi:tetratricopeptide (TPR) repeat protein